MPPIKSFGWCVIPGDDIAHYLYCRMGRAMIRSKCGKLIARWDFTPAYTEPHCRWCEKVRQYDEIHRSAK